MKRTTKIEKDQIRMAARVEHVIAILSYHDEFTAAQVGNALSADKYDVLFALHRLRNDGKVEHLNSTEQVFRDKWRRARRPYRAESLQAQVLAESFG